MACEPNDLATLARCFSCLPASTLLEIQTYLLCQIVTNGISGGGGGAGLTGAADPEGVVSAAEGTTYYATGTATFWVKPDGAGSGNTGWVQIS